MWKYSDLAGFYNLSGGIVIPDGANIQNYRTPGNYYCTNNAHVATLLNCPIKNAFTMKVEYGSGNGYPIQTIRDYYTRKQYINTYYTDENRWLGWAENLTNTDFQIRTYEITVTANTLTQITSMANAGRNWIPVVVGHGSAIKSNAHVTYDGGKWYIIADVAQLYRIDFYKYPVSL